MVFFRHIFNICGFVSICFPVGGTILYFLPDKQLSFLKYIWELMGSFAWHEGRQMFHAHSEEDSWVHQGISREICVLGFSLPSIKLRTLNYEVWIILNYIDMLITKAVLAARNVRILLYVAMFAKHHSALYRSFGHLVWNLDRSSGSEALICYMKLVIWYCGECILFSVEFSTSGISILELTWSQLYFERIKSTQA